MKHEVDSSLTVVAVMTRVENIVIPEGEKLDLHFCKKILLQI
jgi:hypothetical protein